jgi:hypothetical protein
MRLRTKLVAGCASVVVSLFPLAAAPAVASAAPVADAATILNGTSCTLVSADDAAGACHYVLNSATCSGKVTLTCNITATLTEPGGDRVGLSYRLTGTVVGNDIFVFATVVTGTATDDGATFQLAGIDAGSGCQIIDCGFSTPVVLSLVW